MQVREPKRGRCKASAVQNVGSGPSHASWRGELRGLLLFYWLRLSSQDRCYRLEVSTTELMSRFPVFYCSPVGVGAGFKPVEARDAYEAEQIVQREYPGAVTASLSERVTNEEEIKRLFMGWLEKV